MQIVSVFALVALLAAGLSAAQILPTLEYMSQSHRGGGLPYEWATTSSFPPINLITFAVPGLFGDDVRLPYWGEGSLWESTAFCGVTVNLLMLMGLFSCLDRTTVFWGGAAVVVMLVSLGKYSPIYDLCYSYLPGVALFRGVAKLSLFVSLAVAVLAGRGVDAAFDNPKPLDSIRRIIGVFGFVLGLAGALACVGERGVKAPPPEWWRAFFDWVRSPGTFTLLQIAPHEKAAMQSSAYDFALQQLAISLAFLAIMSLILLFRRRLKSTGAVLALVLVCVGQYLFANPYVVVSDTAPYREPARSVREAIDDPGPWRFVCVCTDDSLVNQFAYEKLPTPGGVEASLLTRYTFLFQSLTGADAQHLTYLTLPAVHESLFDLLNVKYYAAANDVPQIGDSWADRLVQSQVFTWKGVSYDLYENQDVLPRASIVHQIREVDYPEAGRILLPKLLSDGPKTASFIEGRLPFSIPEVADAVATTERCGVTSHSPTRTTIEVTLAQPGVVLVGENWYPGWEALVDDELTSVFPANLAMQAIPVRAGAHTIELRYRSPSFRTGATITLLSLGLVIAGFLGSTLRPANIPLWLLTPFSDKKGRGTKVASDSGITHRLAAAVFFSGLITMIVLWGAWIHCSFVDVTPPDFRQDAIKSPGTWAIAVTLLVFGCGWQLFRMDRRTFLFGSATLAILFPLTLGLAEGFARLTVPAWPALGLHGVAPKVAENSWAKSVASGKKVELNDWGQRDRPREIAPRDGIKRFGFIGDSFLEEASSKPVSTLMEEELRTDNVEILNLGVSASSPDEYYFRLRNIALPLGVDHCVMFIFAGNDFVEAEQSLESYLDVAAVYPRSSLLSAAGLLGINHLLTNHRRPVLQAWLGSTDLRKQEELRSLVIATSDDEQIRQLLLSSADVAPDQQSRLQERLADPIMVDFFDMLRHPDAGLFRSYYLSRGLWSAAVGGGQWEENSEDAALFWVSQAADLCQREDLGFTLVIIPEAFAVDRRMVDQWAPLTNMRHLTEPCRVAAERMAKRAEAAGIDVIDLHDDFENVPGTYLNMDGHWSDKGTRLASKVLLRELFEDRANLNQP